MKRILVTGATGFLGRHVIQSLLDDGGSGIRAGGVRILCRGENPWPDDPRIEPFSGDVRDFDSVRKAVSGTERVIHLAGMVRRDPESADAMRAVHLDGTRHVCEAALLEGAPGIVLASTSGTIAVSRRPIVHDESAPYPTAVTKHWPYYVSKIEQEQLALSYREKRGLEVVVLNPSILLGPGDIHRSSTDDVRNFIEGRVPNVPTGGFSFVDVRDAARTFVAALDRARPGQRYLIGGHNISVREFFRSMERLSGVRGPRMSMPEWPARAASALARRAMAAVGRGFPIDDTTIEMAYRFWYLDNRRAVRELGFQARPADVTIRDTIEFIRNQGSEA